ncbi:MAG: glycine oxidase ThiO [Thermoactinomyces sp.]
MQHSDVIVVGGGLIGSAIAFFLAKSGTKVVVLERDRIGAHSSSAAAGMLGAQAEMSHPGPLADACLKSHSMFPALAEELLEITGLDIEMNRKGLLKPALTETEANELKELAKWQRAVWLDRRECQEKEEFLGEEVIGCLFFPEDYQVSAPRLTQAFARAARHWNARFIEGCQVIDIQVKDNRVQKLVTSNGVWTAETVVLATGAWTGWIARLLGINLPVYPVKGEALAAYANRTLLQHTLYGKGVYIVPKANGELIIGATEKENQLDTSVTIDAVYTLLEKAIRYYPILKELKVSRVWAGIRPGTPDQMPYIGKLAPLENLIVASGHYRNGILLSPWTGQVVSEIIHGKERDLSPFAPLRFIHK